MSGVREPPLCLLNSMKKTRERERERESVCVRAQTVLSKK